MTDIFILRKIPAIKRSYLFIEAASWSKLLGARLLPLGSRVRVSVIPCGFRGRRNGVCVGFSRVSLIFHYHKFHSTISPYLSHLFRFISFHKSLWCCDRPPPLLFTDFQIASYSSTRPSVLHELRMVFILSVCWNHEWKIPVWNHSQSFHKYPLNILAHTINISWKKFTT